MDWDDASKLLLRAPWSYHTADDDTTLLFKVARTPDHGLAMIATDLERVWFDSLSKRLLYRRLDDAYRDTQASESLSQQAGALLESDEQHEDAASELVEGIRKGGRVDFDSSAFQFMFTFRLLSFTFRFTGDLIGPAAPACLSLHLIRPLIGLSSALLSLCVPNIDDGSLALAIDASARAERVKDGRSAKALLENGATALGRWSQRFIGVQEKDIMLISKEQPLPVQAKKKSPSSSSRNDESCAASTSTSSTSGAPGKSVGKQMLDHRAPTSSAGERVTWEDTQPGRSSPRPSKDIKDVKGKEKFVDEGTENEREEELTPPPPHQPASSLPETEQSTFDTILHSQRRDESHDEPSTASEDESTAPQPPPPSLPSQPKKEESTPPSVTNKEEKRKAAREAEEAEELEIRKRAMAKAKAAAEAKAKGAPQKKKRKL